MNGHASEEPLLAPGDDKGPKAKTLGKKRPWWNPDFTWVSKQRDSPALLLQLAVFFGVVSGIVAWVYDTYFETVLWLVWEVAPKHAVQPLYAHLSSRLSNVPPLGEIAWVYILLTSTVLGLLVGVTQKLMGSPGDLPDTVKCIHVKGSIPLKQAPSMFVCSAFSIAAGGSLGPEAALLALCGSTISYLGRKMFGFQGHRLRNCAIMGMTAGLAAFFGVALGGALFALEVLHRTGLQFFEVMSYALVCGLVCITVFRGLTHKPLGAIWDFKAVLATSTWQHVLLGALMGVLGAGLAYIFTKMRHGINWCLSKIGLHEHHTPIACGVLGGFCIGCMGVLLPATMFWGEFEINAIINPADTPLPHVWPKGGVFGLASPQSYGPWMYVLIGFAKMLIINVTVTAGFRGGFIFPLFFTGTAFGLALSSIKGIPFVSDQPPVFFAMTIAAALDTSITRTPLATTHILSVLSGSVGTTVPSLAAAFTGLFLTLKCPYILTQQDRIDVVVKELDEIVDENGQPMLIEHIDNQLVVVPAPQPAARQDSYDASAVDLYPNAFLGTT